MGGRICCYTIIRTTFITNFGGGKTDSSAYNWLYNVSESYGIYYYDVVNHDKKSHNYDEFD